MTDREPLSTEPYKGVRDFYPEDWMLLSSVFDRIRAKLRTYGFEEYQASPMERAELYESKTSEEIVNEQTYTFTDRGDRRVTLRPEMTPTLARMIAHKRRELVYPVRWFSIGNRFRYERPQKGRLREFYQVDVDIVGIEGSRAEGEVVVIAHALLKEFGAADSDFTIRVNSRKLLNAACAACDLDQTQSTAYIALLDRKNKMEAGVFEEAREPFRKNGADPLEVIEAGSNADVQTERETLEALMSAWSARGITNVVFDPTVVRGFLYYTGLVFEVFDTNPENPRALMGGGRYDELVGLFGGEQIPAVGFAFGDVTFMDFLRTHNLLPRVSSSPTLFIGTPAEEDMLAAQEYADTLREFGLSVVVNSSGKSLGDQVKEAVRRNIPYFVAYGSKEQLQGSVTLKILAESREEEVADNVLAQHLFAKELS